MVRQACKHLPDHSFFEVRLMNFIRRTAAALCLITAPALAIAEPDEDYKFNAEGLTLSKMIGRTTVGTTRDSSKTWSLYLARDKTAFFTFSSGKTATATWVQKSQRIICFKGLNKDRPADEVCKRAQTLGRGTDWMTINLKTKDGKTTYEKATKGEKAGSSQMVYSHAGRKAVDQTSYIADVSKWPGHVVVGRSLKGKEAWSIYFDPEGTMLFTLGTGRQESGRYRISSGEICMTFAKSTGGMTNLGGCYKPKVQDGKIRWARSSSGSATSELVYMVKAEPPAPGPRTLEPLSRDSYHMVLADPTGRTIATVNRRGSGSIELYDAAARSLIGSHPAYAQDMSFRSDGLRLAGDYKSNVWVLDIDTGLEVWSHTRAVGADFSELAFANDGQLLVGDNAGWVTVFDAETGAVQSSVQVAQTRISDIAVSRNGHVLIGSRDGALVMAQVNALDKTVPVAGAPAGGNDNSVHNVAFESNGERFYALYKDGTLLTGSSGATVTEADVDKIVKLNTGTAYVIAQDPTRPELFVAGKNAAQFIKRPSLQVVETLPKSESGWRISTAYMGKSGAMISHLEGSGLETWARDYDNYLRLKKVPFSVKGPANKRVSAIRTARKKQADRYAELRTDLNVLYSNGDCTVYEARAKELKTADRKDDCAAAKAKRAQIADYALALKELRCDAATAIRTEHGHGSTFREEKCRAQVEKAQAQARFLAAVEAKECTVVRELGPDFGAPTAGSDCDMAVALEADSARKMYFAAVKFDSSKDRTRAKTLYTEVMNRFPDDDLAIDAANRLTALNDMEVLEQRQSENEAALAAAQAAIAKANAEKAAAERRAKAQADQARAAAAREAKAARQAADARARAAEARAREAEARARAQTQSQPRRNTACDHVAPGKRFTVKGGGFFGIGDATYRVIGISRQGGFVTAQMLGTDIQKDFRCSRVR